MTKGQATKIEQEEKEKDRKQRDRESKRKLFSDIISSALGFGGHIGANLVKQDTTKGGGTKFVLNDPQWYKNWTEDYARYCNWVMFNNLKTFSPGMGISSYSSTNMPNDMRSTPGVMAVNFIPMLGYCSRAGANLATNYPINLAMARSISQIRKATGRQVNYNPDVLGLYFLSAIEIASLLSDLRFVLKVATEFRPNNGMIPEALISAKGWSYNFIRDNRAELAKWYIEYATRFNSNIVIPKDLSLLSRRVWLQSVCLHDADLARAQYYLFQQECFGIFRNDETGIDFSPLGDPKYSMVMLRMHLDTAFSRLEESVTMIELVGDIRAGIPAANFAKLPTDIESGELMFGASHEVLAQIHNLRSYPVDDVKATAKIVSNTTYLTQNVTISDSPILGTYNQIAAFVRAIEALNTEVTLDTYTDELTPDDVFTMTRLTPVVKVIVKSSTMQIDLLACGTELVTNTQIYYYDSNFAAYNSLSKNTFLFQGDTDALSWLSMLSAFDWHPFSYVVYVDSSDQYTRITRPFGEFGNAFNVGANDLLEVHRLCVCSECYLPDKVFTAAYGKPY